MTYKKFIEAYEKATEQKKSALVKKHVVTNYVSFERKISESKKIVAVSNYVEIDGKTVFKQNSPLSYMLFVLRIVANYTDITWDEAKENLDAFNELNRVGAVEDLIAAIPQKEYGDFSTVFKMVHDDEYENFRSLVGYLDTKIDALGIMFDELNKLLEQAKE